MAHRVEAKELEHTACHMLQPLRTSQDYGPSGVGQEFGHMAMGFLSLELAPVDTLPYLILTSSCEAVVLGHITH